jgi:hypothetical protein
LERLTVAWTEAKHGDAAGEALACLGSEALGRFWRRPTTACVEVWREQAFEMVLHGSWVTGIFDRVVVERDIGGRALRASVVDYKTDQIDGPAGVATALARHGGQLNLYRQVAAVLIGLALEDVECILIFTRLRLAAVVPWQ